MNDKTVDSVHGFRLVLQNETESPVTSCNEGGCYCYTGPEIETYVSIHDVPCIYSPSL
jgi:hypothetical protein